jgi:regulator of protease activity HflC (stomatin/prohibitin superfamily)
MSMHVLMKTVTVKDGERALLTRNGRLERVLGPGRHPLLDLRRQLTAEIFNVVRTEFNADRYAVLKAARPDLAAELFEAVETKANEIAIVSLDGRPVHLMTPWQARVYWKVATRIDVERIDVASDIRVTERHLAMIERNRPTVVTEAVVENHEAGLLHVEGKLVERLAPGRHAFWTAGRKIEVKRLDLRPQAVEITAQEMLTKDRIALRVTLTAFRRIVDPERVVASVPDVDAWLYRLVQFAIREAVAGRTLGEGRDPARRDPRARQQGGGGGAGRQGEPDPPSGGDRGDALAPEHRQADGGEPAAAAAQGAGVAGAARREGRPHRPARRRRPGPRRAAEQAGPHQVRGECVTRRVAHGRPFTDGYARNDKFVEAKS